MRLLITILLALCLTAVSAQTKTQPSATEQKEKTLEGIAVGVDLVGPAMLCIGEYGDLQATVTANLRGRYLPTVEVGYGKADITDDDTDVRYKTSAPFFRLGCDFNLLKNKHDDYRLLVGLRYGFTSFSYDTYTPYDDGTSFTDESEKVSLHWLELCFGVDAKMWGPVHMGWSLRYRRRLNSPDYVNTPQYAPGYGDASQGTRFMALYTVSVNF